jgi:hypothetical protein
MNTRIHRAYKTKKKVTVLNFITYDAISMRNTVHFYAYMNGFCD